MSEILSRDTEERRGERTSDPMMRMFEVAAGESESGDGRMVRPFLLVDLAAALDYLRGTRGGTGRLLADGVERTLLSQSSEAESRRARGGRSRGESRRGSPDGERNRRGESSGSGTSVLPRLFLVGAVVGLAYVLRKRSGSVDEVASKATDRARSVADRTARRSGEAAGRAETMTDEAADTIRERGETAAEAVQEGSETAAEQVEEGGERAADQIEGAGETVEEVEEKAEEKAGGDGNEGSEGGQSSGE